jgi:pyruvate/2-oxoglutarate dehydrogenase complex dihydrolipoamide dehydrogenase (E3) component
VPATTFLTPPLARVGLNETQARDQGRRVLVASKAIAGITATQLRDRTTGECVDAGPRAWERA